MDWSSISQMGFAAAWCIALGVYIYRMMGTFMEQSAEREKRLSSVLAEAQTINRELTDTNSQFVEVLKTYKADLDTIKDDISDIKERINGD